MGDIYANGTKIAAEGQANSNEVDLGGGSMAKVEKHQGENGYAQVTAGFRGLTSTQTIPANGREIDINGVKILHERA